MKRTILLTGMLIALGLIAFAPTSVMAQTLPYDDLIDVGARQRPVSEDIPWFRDSTNNPIEVDFSGSNTHTNGGGSYLVSISTESGVYVRGPYSGTTSRYPWPNLQEDSSDGSEFSIWWHDDREDGTAFLQPVVDEVD
ncbi:hypothetical protein BMS3Bbin04_01172 [bacterium BMS3Bbin04]|nr:hypothetical protein BMS3Bbin04_01172 [bacterium BMS3Bbin04]